MSGINIVDIESDGDKDILFTNGDVLDGDFPEDYNLWDYHGLSILENLGDGEFDYKRMIAFTGAYDSAMFDIDNDGVPNQEDNCFFVYNPNQQDADRIVAGGASIPR